MIDLTLLRASPAQVRAALARRGDSSLIRLLDEIEALDMKRRTLTAQLDQLKAERNDAARADALVAKAQGGLPEATAVARRKLGERVTALESELRQIETTLEAKALFVPNPPLPEVPDEPTILRSWGTPATKGGKPHWEIAERLGILDLPRGAKLSGSGFPVLMGAGARLARGLINFMLELHTREHGYVEDDAYRTATDDLFLVPTAEVPVTNLHRDEILDGTTLPMGYVAYTPCFRREAGAAGKDTRGLLRVHQFDKVELVRFCRAPDSPAEHEKLTGHAEAVLQKLELPYRIAVLPANDFGFSAAKTYDLEAWAPGVGQWLEVSSSSTFTDYQARRANIRVRPRPGEKAEFVHTLNASGVALPRTIAALLEIHQQPDGSVTVPPALVPYVGTDRIA